MFLDSDGALWLETNFRPEALGNERSWKPVHRKTKVVKFLQMDIGADSARLEAGKKLLRLSLDNPAKDGGGGRNRTDTGSFGQPARAASPSRQNRIGRLTDC